MKNSSIFIFLIFTIFKIECYSQTIYPHMQYEQIPFNKGFVNLYFFENEQKINKDCLFIYIDGSGPVSVLGKKVLKWTIPYYFYKQLNNQYDLLIPEKPDTKMGGIQIKNYRNKEYRISGYATAINYFLDKHDYHNICLIGFSEGGVLVPKIYFKINKRDKIKAVVLMGSGGLSLYECFKIQKNKPDLKFNSTDSLNKVERLLNKKNKTRDEIIWLDYYMTDSINEIRQMNIPILVLHGEKDINCPVESSRFIKDEFIKLDKNNLTYKEYMDMDHGFNGKFEFVIDEIISWFTKIFLNKRLPNF